MESEVDVVMFLAKAYVTDPRVRNEAESLTGAGYKVTVLSWDRDGNQPRETVVSNVRSVNFRLLQRSEFSKVAYALSALLLQFYCVSWCIVHMKHRYLVHANDFNTLLAGILVKSIHHNRVRLVYDCHELTPSAYAEWYGFRVGLLVGALERIFLRNVDATLTVSPPVKEYLDGISRAPVTVVYNTIRISSVPTQDRQWWRNKLGLTGLVVSYVGVLRQDIGLDELIVAARYFKESNTSAVRFLIVGDGPDLKRIKADARGVEDYVKFVPRVPHAEALGYVTASNISYAIYRNKEVSAEDKHYSFVTGNSKIALPWKVFEAMACGTVVFVREDTFTWRFVNDLGFGLSGGSGNTKDITERLDWAVHNPEVIESMSSIARSHFESRYNWEKMSERLLGVYGSISWQREEPVDKQMNVSHGFKVQIARQ
jgi:glycosyltransferase involved in cell wall biosynthesis